MLSAKLFNQIQVTNDRTMQAILTAAQVDNKLSQALAFQSHELTRSMKNDSVAMKTVSKHASHFPVQLRLTEAL